jgi:hypothetical protein
MKIREGAYYRARNGVIYGPMMRAKAQIRYPFRVADVDLDWCADGFFQSDKLESGHDLISEVYVSDTPPAVKETEAELREMMRDPRYWRQRDPEWVKRVTDGFRALVGGDTPPADAPAPETKTLRDEFAMAALQGMLARESDLAHKVARYAYQYAAAMMEARKK